MKLWWIALFQVVASRDELMVKVALPSSRRSKPGSARGDTERRSHGRIVVAGLVSAQAALDAPMPGGTVAGFGFGASPPQCSVENHRVWPLMFS